VSGGGGSTSLLAFSDLVGPPGGPMTFADPGGSQLGKLSGGLSPSAAPPPVQQPPPGSSSQDPQDDSLLYASAASSRLSGGGVPLSGKSSQQLDYGAGTSAAGYGSPSAAALMGYSPLTGGGGSGTGDHMATASGGGGVVTKQEAFGLEATTVQQQQQAAAAAAASLAEFNQATSKGHEILSQVCYVSLKGQCHEIFCFWFFKSISFPPAPEYPIRTVSNFFENSRRYTQLKVDHRCR
jgi:hypothetical protein